MDADGPLAGMACGHMAHIWPVGCSCPHSQLLLLTPSYCPSLPATAANSSAQVVSIDLGEPQGSRQVRLDARDLADERVVLQQLGVLQAAAGSSAVSGMPTAGRRTCWTHALHDYMITKGGQGVRGGE